MKHIGFSEGVTAARRVLVRVTVLFVVLVGLWVFIQSGIPFTILVDLKAEKSNWLQTLNGWFFLISSGWLLYLLVDRSLRTIAETEAALRLRDRAMESSVNAIMITDHTLADTPIVYVNPAFERITGYSAGEAIGRNPRFLQADDRDQAELEAVRLALKEQRECRVVMRAYRKDGGMYWSELSMAPVRDESGGVTHYVGIQNDITEARRYQDELARQANFDTLTGLPNRNLLLDRIVSATVRADRYEYKAVVTIVDLDNFKLVNDGLGHGMGDELLKLIAERMSSRLRGVDTVARLGGDEFALVLVDQTGERVVPAQVQRILDAFVNPFLLGDREVFITASVGVALYPQDGRDAETLLNHAEVAMYRAKDRGRNCFQLFAADMNAMVNERLLLQGKLHRALERGELVLHYQPKLDLRTNRVTGAEALIRWNHPELGMVSPAKFIPLAEETGLILPIGEWVIRTACAECKAWQDAGLPPISVAVNISAKQFWQKDLVDRVAAILRETQLDPRFLELELTESALMHDAQEAISTLERLKMLGVELAVDDFGTGYSSLNYLKRFPVDRLKIDQSFVRNLTTDADDAAIVEAVISLGHSLKLRVIAEGVETAEQLAFLRTHHCDEKQGYLFSKPLDSEQFRTLLREGRMLAA